MKINDIPTKILHVRNVLINWRNDAEQMKQTDKALFEFYDGQEMAYEECIGLINNMYKNLFNIDLSEQEGSVTKNDD